MCHDPRTAQTIWAIRCAELLTEVTEARRVGIGRRRCVSGPLVAVGMRRLGAALIWLGARMGTAPDAPAPPAPPAPPADPGPLR